MELTHDEFIRRGGFDEVTEDKFPGLYAKSKRMIKSLVGTDVEGQYERGFIPFTAYDYYLDALVAQIEYIHFVGFKQISGMNETQDVKIGNFSYTEGMSRGGSVIENPQFSNQVFEYLSAGGFFGGAVMTIGD